MFMRNDPNVQMCRCADVQISQVDQSEEFAHLHICTLVTGVLPKYFYN
jgi:hypothetical protein